VRGIAALLVAVSHAIGTTTLGPHLTRFPSSLLLAGDGAVFVFFALSGCVLFLSLQHTEALAYFAYLTKRIFRIYPPFAFAILASAVLLELVKPHAVPGVSDWFNRHWESPPTSTIVAGHLAMTDLPSLQQLDSVMWSLVHEVRLSVVFPFIALWVVVNWRVAVVVSTLVSASCCYVELHNSIDWPFDPLKTLSYLFLFTAGAALAAHAGAVRRTLARCPQWWQMVLWIVALWLVTIPPEQYLSIATGAGALAIIALAFGTSSVDRVLSNNPVPIWFGRVSYSLYLVHFPIILASVHLLYGRLPLPAILCLSLATSLGVAELMNRFVEQPSIALGRRLASLSALQWKFPLRRKLAASEV
jgi:peptidoglycan/LPS O-acetylase OafA/YrhL